MLYGQSKMTIGAYIPIVIPMFMVYRSLTKAVVPLIAITTVIAILNAFMFVFGIKRWFWGSIFRSTFWRGTLRRGASIFLMITEKIRPIYGIPAFRGVEHV